jgi:hypothetical protein
LVVAREVLGVVDELLKNPINLKNKW